MRAGRDIGAANRQLRLFITVDLWFTAVACVVVAGLSTVLPPLPVYPLVVAMVAVAAITMAMGLGPLGRGDVQTAVAWVASANWGIAIVASTVVVFLWPLMLLVAVLPCFLAVSFLQGRTVRVYLVVSLVVAVSTVLLGLLQDISGFSEGVPVAVRNTMLITVTPVIAALIGLLSLSNNERMQRALVAALDAQRALTAQAAELRASRARVVAAGDQERQRIERDLHDGAQQRLIGIKLHLSEARSLIRSDPVAAAATLERLGAEVSAAHRELRELAQGVYPPVLIEHGLAQALRSVADRSVAPVILDLHDPIPRGTPGQEAAVYFSCVEGLQNAAKHGGDAVSIQLSAGASPEALWFCVTDDGTGFDPSRKGSGTGLANMTDRLGAVGGSIHVTAGPGQGVTVSGRVPRSGGHPGVIEGVADNGAR